MHSTDTERAADGRATLEDDIPKMEPWLGVLIASFVPTIALFFLPDSFRYPLFIVSSLLLLASVVMLVRREIKRPRR
jgi:hypothetical protein